MTGEFLLDTCTILWAVADPERLSPGARRAIRSAALVISVASYWEVAVKARKGQLSIADPISWWDRATRALASRVLSIHSNHVAVLTGLVEHHKDPFDRILIAQAIADGLTIITSDEKIHRYPVKVQW